MQMSGKVAVITGGASGLGEATLRMLVDEGAQVAIFDVNEARGKLLVEEFGESVVFYSPTDVTNAAQVEQNVASVVQKFGRIDVLVSCAGIAPPAKVLGKDGPMALEKFATIVQVNLIGTFNVLRVVARVMQENAPNEDGERGVIVNTASVAAFEGQIGQAAYAASKAGVVGMTLPIAREFARDGIRMMAIAPGLVETPMFNGLPDAAKATLASSVPFPNRLGKPSEYAQLVKSIVENPMLNGEVIRLDGAIRMAPK
ncbi:3-hydroxyacyl-CoA dehydrogenase [Paenisporosarcina cavernae]|uniref:3-hydroxyacyl-CoA dehydrogenase n=1 Tax=Paenisporosarcina cavernae TaxID=2320858 RepID=A0A385YPL8_9BACL|nr:3-hydroxyacyl-CoA dehydrogenase [Paenisporosarcina cavernae]AYC28665.1 3-hydroxyacyl-CoA dehydrogenase [Paenisporosarcina cavernae]